MFSCELSSSWRLMARMAGRLLGKWDSVKHHGVHVPALSYTVWVASDRSRPFITSASSSPTGGGWEWSVGPRPGSLMHSLLCNLTGENPQSMPGPVHITRWMPAWGLSPVSPSRKAILSDSFKMFSYGMTWLAFAGLQLSLVWACIGCRGGMANTDCGSIEGSDQELHAACPQSMLGFPNMLLFKFFALGSFYQKIYFTFDCMFVYMCGCLWRPEKGCGCPESGAASCCEPLKLGAKNWKQEDLSTEQALQSEHWFS